MKNWEKILFWVFTVIIVVDSLYWQWQVKLTTEPIIPPPGGIVLSLIGDVIPVFIWFWLLLKIYKKAFPKNPQNNEK